MSSRSDTECSEWVRIDVNTARWRTVQVGWSYPFGKRQLSRATT